MKLWLASGSPRRRELLTQIGLKFDIHIPETVEEIRPGEAAVDYVCRLATQKAFDVFDRGKRLQELPDHLLVVAADTIVCFGEMVLEKPASKEEAIDMLRKLSGNTHIVHTGFAIIGKRNEEVKDIVRRVSTSVTFRPLSEIEIRAYVSTGEPFDKAGGYGAQGVGACMVDNIEGSYSNVVGLPLAELVNCMIHDFGIPYWNLSSQV